MVKRNKLVIGFYCVLLSTVLFISYSSNPPDGYTGAPGDSLCSACHDTPPANVTGTISLTGLPATVSYNTTYSLTITSTVTMGSPLTAGFQLVALNASNQNSGNLATTEPDVGTDFSGGREYVEHRGDKTIVGGTVSWNFTWTAPASGTGNITLYAASNLTNNNTENTGDRIITNSFSTSLPGGGNPVTVAITNHTNVNCFGGNNGTATAQASNGTPPYTYLWSNGQSGPMATNLAAGVYFVTATDNGGGTATANVTITQPPLLVASITSVTHVSCFGGNNGVAVASGSGGTPPYTYTWSNGATGPAIFNLTAGSYTVTVKDAKNCTKTAVAVVTQPALLVANIVSQNNVSCFGGNNGSVVVNAVGGTAPYNYSWSNGGSGPIITNLTAGTYVVTVVDSHGCIATKSVVITQPPLLVAVIPAHTNVLCFGGTNGSATASASGGTTPYTYAWSNGGNTASISGLAAGSYTVTVTDNKGCTDTESVTITQPGQMVINGAITQATCHGDCDGAIDITVTGGVLPLSYLWGGGETVPDLTDLCAGDYSFTVTDANGCTATQTFTVEEPAPVGIEAVSLQQVDCHGNATGAVTVAASGEPGPFTYLWSNGQTTAALSGLAAGSYTVTATNGLSCTGVLTIDISQPAALDPNVSVTHETASGANNGTATSSPTGGTPPYAFAWSNNQNTAAITGLAPGNYTVTVTDTNGCMAVKTVTINPFGCVLTVELSSIPVSCSGGNDGQATAIPLGGTLPFSFEWSNGAGGASIAGLEAGTYAVTVFDGSNCSATGAVEVGEPSPLEITAMVLADVECFGDATGSAVVEASGGTPDYTYVWGDTIATLPPGEGFLRDNLSAGNYSVAVADGNGCETSIDFAITQPAQLTLGVTSTGETAHEANDGTATAAAQGGAGSYTYLWSNGSTAASLSGLSPGAYQVTSTDANGCTAAGEALVEAYNCTLALSTGFSDVQCNGASDGTANAVPSGGVEPYSFAWSNGATESSISGLGPGIYSVSVLDAANCPVEAEVTIAEPAPLTVVLDAQTPVSCNGGSDGSASVSAAGGVPGYTFTWSNGATGATAENLAAGTYTVSVLDANLCEATLEVTITQPDPLDAQASSTNETANGAGDGTASVDPAGGTAPYDILWSTGETTPTITGLVPGVYTATVTDAEGCTAEGSVAVNPFDCALVVSVLAEDVSCSGLNDGSLTYAITGASDPVEVHLNGELWEGGTVISALVAGSYTLMVSDASFCIFTGTIEIAEPAPLELAVTALDDLVCAGEASGSVSVLASGGNGGFVYQWADILPGNNLPDREDLPAGTYSVTATDAKGCEGSLSVLIEETVLEWTLADLISVGCAGDQDGSAELSASGGTEPYQFQWPNGGNAALQTGLSAGIYFPTITDANDCSIVATVEISVLDEEAPVVVTQDIFLYLDSEGHATLAADDLDGGSTDNCAISSLEVGQTHFDCAHLGVNQVELAATDSNGNSALGTAEVTVLDSVPPVIICPISFSVSTCEGVQHIVEYAITWGDNCTSSDPVLVSGLPSGSVFPVGTTVINWSVGDQSGNMSDCSFSVSIAVTELEALVPTSTLTFPGESTGTATALVLNGTPPFTYLWDDPQAQVTATAINLAEGTYTVQVTDVFGCEATASVLIEAYPQIVVQIQSVTDETNGLANGSIEINVIGGSPPYSYEWSKDGLAFSAAEDPDGLSEGGYTVKITDAVGCTFTSEVIVVDNITGVGELSGQNRYRIFPNPGSDFLWVEWRGPVQGELRAELLDINGKVHLKSALKTARTQLDTHGLTPGVYLLCLYADGWKATEKVLIIR